MTNNIINLSEYRPHLAGPAVCVNCKHEWEGVSPLGVVDLQCPECQTFKGVFKSFVYPEQFWVCNCGSWVLMKSITGVFMCAGCGVPHEE